MPDYGYELGGIAALDTAAGVLYWPGQQMGAGDNAPYYLVGLSIADASVTVRCERASRPLHCGRAMLRPHTHTLCAVIGGIVRDRRRLPVVA